jgi:hypothetical protein
MKARVYFAAILYGNLALSVASAPAYAEAWKQIDNPKDVRQLIVDKALDGKYWKFYFRSDGRMAYEQGGFTSVREWKISAGGAICMNIYSMPDKTLGCQILYQTDGKPVRYQLKHKNGRSVVQIVEPDQALIDAVSKRAGKVK